MEPYRKAIVGLSLTAVFLLAAIIATAAFRWRLGLPAVNEDFFVRWVTVAFVVVAMIIFPKFPHIMRALGQWVGKNRKKR
jgi:hypothetical protein